MTDESGKVPPVTDATPPVEGTNVAPADIPRDSLGRSMVNKRGKKPGAGSAAKPQGQTGVTQAQLKNELAKRLPKDPKDLTDKAVGDAINGAFSAIGLFAGPHWRLFSDERESYGEVFGPLARLYGQEALVKWMTILMAIPVVTATIGPRVAVQTMIHRKEIEKKDGRKWMIRMKAMMAAESELDLNRMVNEDKAILTAKANAATNIQSFAREGLDMAAQLSAEEMQMDGVTPNAETSQAPAAQPKDPASN